MQDLTSRDFWDARAKDYKTQGVMTVLADVRAYDHEKRVKEVLALWKDKSVLDVACGYGRFSKGMDHWTGVDFSEEMKSHYPGTKPFIVADVREWQPDRQYDVVFSVIALSSLKQTPQEFCERWRPHAREYVACFETDTFYIFPLL